MIFKFFNFIYNTFFKGWVGEQKTAINLSFSLDEKVYNVFHDLIIPSDNGTTQIDHLIVSPFGLFIVETKNKTGWIFGGADQANWTQVVFKQKYTFQNPLRQTYRQRLKLAEFLRVHETFIEPIVYFVGSCEFRTEMPKNVINSNLGGYIKSYQGELISPDEVIRIINVLVEHLKTSKLTSYDHVRSLNERHESKTTCPRCGSNLVAKIALKGSRPGSKFLGCSKYPLCRFTKST